MSAPHRYRISVTPIEADGHQCSGRCSIEFEQQSNDNWMHQLEQLQRQRTLSSKQDAAVVLASGLLRNLAETAASQPTHVLTALQPQLDQLLAKLGVLKRDH